MPVILAAVAALALLAATECDTRRNTQEAERKADLAARREAADAAATARDFADSDAAGYIDRTGLETS